MKVFSSILVASVFAVVSATALADQEASGTQAAARPALAEVHPSGAVARYITGPEGHVRGFMLQDGTVVFTGPRAGDKMAADVPVGQTVRVDGRAGAGTPNVVWHASVYGQHGLVAEPPPRGAQAKVTDPEQRQEMRRERREQHKAALAKLPAASLDGTVQAVVKNPRGHARELLLSNGGNVLLERSLTRAMGETTIKAGDVIHASGKGGSYKNGSSIVATELSIGSGPRFSGTPL